jgi:hypothetical protein
VYTCSTKSSNFFRIFWTPNDQKRLVATASTRGPIRSRHVALARALAPRSRSASASPPSRPPLARAGAPARARARRYRPLSPGASAIARRRPLARLSPARGRQRPLLARAAARTGTSLNARHQLGKLNMGRRSTTRGLVHYCNVDKFWAKDLRSGGSR